MLFEEMPLYLAVHQVRLGVSRPSSDEWTSTMTRDAFKLVLNRIIDNGWPHDESIPWSQDDVREVWMKIRKSSDEKLQLKCEVAATHGERCFYANRGLGDCSDEVELDRILPGSRGGRYTLENCIIACSFHNQSRSDTSIETFIAKGNTHAPTTL